MANVKKAEAKAPVEKEVVMAVPAGEAAEAASSETDKKASVKKEITKKETVKKAAAAPKKATTPKRTAEKAALTKVYIQYEGREVSADELVDSARKAYVDEGGKASDIKTIEVYVKPEENAAYYVVNGEGSDNRKIEL